MDIMDIGAAVSQSKSYTDQYLTTGSTPMGSWNASTNTPHITQGSGSVGQYYDVVEAGTWDGVDFLVGDRLLFAANSNKWERIPTGVEQDASHMVVAFIDQTTTNLPTTRTSGKPLVVSDSVKVKSTATLPFEVNGITFDSYLDEAEWNGTAWQEKSYQAGKTNEIKVNKPLEESLSGIADYQSDVNKEFVKEHLKELKFRGYISSTEPTGLIIDGSIWYEGSTNPTTFPINVKTYTNNSWSSTTSEYTPANLDWLYNIDESINYFYSDGWKTLSSKIFIDTNDLSSITNPSNQAIYRLNYKIYKINGARVENVIFYKSLGSTVVTNTGVSVNGQPEVAYEDIVISDIIDWISAGYIEVGTYSNGTFAKYENSMGSILFNIKTALTEEDAYDLYFNPTGTAGVDNYISITVKIDDVELTDTSTRMDLGLVGVDDIHTEDTHKQKGIDIVLGQGSTSNPDIINDDVAYKYANNKTSSNNYINTKLDEVKSMAEGSNKTYFVATLPSAGNRQLNAYYYVETSTANTYRRWFIDSSDGAHDLGTTQIDLSTLIPKTAITTPSASSTDDQVASAKSTYDNFAPINAVYSKNSLSVSVGECVFNVRNVNNGREIQRKIFFASMADPFLPNTSIYGDCITTIFTEGHDEASTHSQTTIKQEFDVMYAFPGTRRKFVRYGTLSGIYGRAVYDNRASITWLAWIPIEYPNTVATLTPIVNTYYLASGSSFRFNVTGGILTLAIENIDIVYNNTSQSVSPTSSSFQFKIDQLQFDLPVKTEQAIYSNLYKDPGQSAGTRPEMALMGITNESGKCYLRCYWVYPHSSTSYRTGRYAGYIVQCLGY